MLTLYGDYLLSRGGEIGIGGLIKLLGNLGLSQQAVRSAVSRMCRARLLKVRRVRRKSYYSLTEDGHSLLTKGAQRIFQRKNSHWDGTWNIVTYSIPEQRRQARDRLRLELNWMGYGNLSEATWISPYDLTKEVEESVKQLQIKEYVQIRILGGHEAPGLAMPHMLEISSLH
jgi:phenylacetic acid degradation operon negative regulatory protein